MQLVMNVLHPSDEFDNTAHESFLVSNSVMIPLIFFEYVVVT